MTTSVKKPPDISSNYRTIKVPLKKILKHYDYIQPKIENAVLRVNKLTSIVYEFIKLFVLKKFENNKKLPTINKVFIAKIFSLIGEKSNKGRKCSNKEDELEEFYKTTFFKIYPDKVCSSHLSYILPLISEEIIRCVETNIKTHFLDYLRKYINVEFKEPSKIEIKETFKDKEKRKELYRELNKEARDIKTDFINRKAEKSIKEYHPWIEEHISNLFPFSINKNVAYDIKANPQKYIVPAVIINKRIEEFGRTPYQVFPQRSNLVPKYITLNTAGILEIINDKNKDIYFNGYSEMINNVKKFQSQTWRAILKLENRNIFNHNKYIFYNQIQTDGISANLLFIKKDFYYKKYGQKLPQDDIDFEIFELNKLTKEECDKHKDKVLIGSDVGKVNILTMTDGNKFYKYSGCRRRADTYTKRSNEIMINEKKKYNISKLEETNYSKRTINSEKFINFLNERKDNLKELHSFYNRPIFRKLALRRFCRTKGAEETMLNEIENKFGSNLLIGLGDWSQPNQMKGCIPTPNKGIIKVLSKRFDIVSVDEYRTSKLYNKDTSIELKNLKVKGKSIHMLLTPQRKPNGVVLNRDTNASLNILTILKEYIHKQARPEAFKRKANI